MGEPEPDAEGMIPPASDLPLVLHRLSSHLRHMDRAVQMQYGRILSGTSYRGSERQHMREADVLMLAVWTPDLIWNAYAAIDIAYEHPKVHRADRHTVTDLVSLVRFTLGQDDELVPYAKTVQHRYAGWLRQQEQAGATFTDR